MGRPPLEYLLPKTVEISDLPPRLEGFGTWKQAPQSQYESTFLDSFDWRLFNQGQVLEERLENGTTSLLLRDLESCRLLGQCPQKAPRFWQGLESAALRQALEPVLEMRCLIPLARLHSSTTELALLNKDRKTVVRAIMERHEITSGKEGASEALPQRLRLVPLKGYDKHLQRMIGYLQKELKLEPANEGVWHQAMAAVGHNPGGYSSKLDLKLDPGQSAQQATLQILRHLLQAMEVNFEGTRTDLDSEFLHDFRVAVRRTRSALGQIKNVLPEHILEQFRPEFARLGAITGPTRDMDVYLLKFEDYRNSLPEEIRPDLNPLHNFLHERQKSEQCTLARELGSAHYRSMVKSWRTWLEKGWSEEPEAPVNATRPVCEVAGKRIRKVFKRTISEGTAINESSPPEDLHELRKTCKKLRYLLEFFQSLYPRKQIRHLIKALKGLQENLGDFQDLEVQAQALRQFSRQMNEQGQAPTETLLAMGMLIAELQQRQKRTRNEFTERFASFAAPANRSLVRKLFVA